MQKGRYSSGLHDGVSLRAVSSLCSASDSFFCLSFILYWSFRLLLTINLCAKLSQHLPWCLSYYFYYITFFYFSPLTFILCIILFLWFILCLL